MTIEEYKNEFDGRPAVVKFGSDWCQPCKVMDKTLERLEPNYPNVKFLHIDVEESPELTEMFHISNIPVTLFISAGGENYERKVGLLPEKGIVAEIEKLLS